MCFNNFLNFKPDLCLLKSAIEDDIITNIKTLENKIVNCQHKNLY